MPTSEKGTTLKPVSVIRRFHCTCLNIGDKITVSIAIACVTGTHEVCRGNPKVYGLTVTNLNVMKAKSISFSVLASRRARADHQVGSPIKRACACGTRAFTPVQRQFTLVSQPHCGFSKFNPKV